jgi:hypothetical protein
MTQKYVKPLVRNLGDVLPNAQGVCQVGSTANLFPGNSCRNGITALGDVCSEGSFPGGTGCNTGSIPAFFGCQVGSTATGTCSTGFSFA